MRGRISIEAWVMKRISCVNSICIIVVYSETKGGLKVTNTRSNQTAWFLTNEKD